MSPQAFTAIIVSVLLNSTAQLLLRKGMTTVGHIDIARPGSALAATALSFWVWGGFACYAVSILIWLYVLSRVEVSVAYPFLSIGYVFAAVMGTSFLGEAVGVQRAFGIAMICIGLFFIARSA